MGHQSPAGARQGTASSATLVICAIGSLLGTKSLTQHKQGQLLSQSGSQRQSCWDPALGVNPTLYPILRGYSRCLAPLCPGCHPQCLSPGRDSPGGSDSPYLQVFPGQHMVMQPEAHSCSDLSPNLSDCPQVNPLLPDSLLVIRGGLEGAKTHSSETNPKRGVHVCLALYVGVYGGVGKKMLGGERRLERHLYLGRMMKKKPLPAAPQSGGPRCSGCSAPMSGGQPCCGVRQAPRIFQPRTYAPQEIGGVSARIPPSLHPFPVPQADTAGPSAVIQQLLHSWHTAASPSRELQPNHHF